jgi:putative hydrolase
MAKLNTQVAERLRQVAELLAEQQANPFRVGAYRRAADTIAALNEDLAGLVERQGSRGSAGYRSSPGSSHRRNGADGPLGAARTPARRRGAGKAVRSIPGVGPKLARRIHDALHVDTLEALEAAAHDGRLESVPGVGQRRAAMLRAALGSMLARTRPAIRHVARDPDVKILFDVDREYRARAAEDALPKIAPKRFNPEGQAWLPILHTERDGWQFTALYSNTARAHELGRTRDWVVIYFHTDTQPEGQRTVVTEACGALAGKRVVRGREQDCRIYYGTPQCSTDARTVALQR